MHLRLRHEIRCRLAAPARNLVAILRLCPRSHEGQHVTDWWIDADLDCNLKAADDELGNPTHRFSASGQLQEVTISASGQVDTFDTAGIVRATAERLPVDIFLRHTPLTAPDTAIRDFVAVRTGRETNSLGRLHALMAAVHGEVALESGTTTRAAGEAFGRKGGNPESHAHVFIASAHVLGIPCRFVNGYLVSRETGSASPHSWTEAFIADLGWVGFDTANNLCPRGNHVRGAVGFDAHGAAFARGLPAETTVHALAVKLLG